MVLVLILAIALGMTITWVLSIILSIMYFIGFGFLLVLVKRKTSNLLLKTHFNLAFALRNENEELYHKFKIKARPGYLSKWIEFHWLSPHSGAIP